MATYTDNNPNAQIAASAGRGALAGAQAGAAVGSIASPWGALIGGIVGAVGGGIYGGVKEKKSLDEAEKEAAEAFDAKQDAQQIAGRARALQLSEDEMMLAQSAAAAQSGSGYDMWHANTYGKM